MARGDGGGGGQGWHSCERNVPRSESQRQKNMWIEFVVGSLLWGLFLQSPGDFPGPKSNIQTKLLRIKTWLLANKPVHFVLLNDSLLCSPQNY